MVKNFAGSYKVTEEWHLAQNRMLERGGEKTLKAVWRRSCLI